MSCGLFPQFFDAIRTEKIFKSAGIPGISFPLIRKLLRRESSNRIEGDNVMKKNGKLKAVIGLIVILAALVGLLFTAIVGVGAEKSGAASNIRLGLDLAGGVSITYQAVGEEKPSDEDMDDTVYKLQRRVESYSTEALVYREGDDRINIEIPGVTDANSILEELGRPGSLYFIRETDEEGNPNYSLNASTWSYELTKDLSQIIADGDAVLSGTDVANAAAGYQTDNMNNQEIVVQLTFTDEGTQKFADATERAFSKGETIGIYYDGAFISVPRVQNVITGGQAVITGESTIEEANILASTIRIGGLKVELEELRSNVVGAQLGQNAIDTSMKAGIVGFVLVVIFMIAVYLLPGFAASLALLIYIGLMVVLLNGFDVTLTLPGIAGILLSIGMAVDANVIIFARIREELAENKSVRAAIDTGYQKALSAIIDGNVTTLIAAAVLGLRGSGSVKGFAQTLALGIVLSMFTALFITKWLMNCFYTLFAKDKKWYGVGKKRALIDFLGKKKLFFTCSIAVVALGFVLMAVNAARGVGALNYSLDFVGGTSTNVAFDTDYSLEDLDAQAVPLFEKVTGDANVQVQKVAGTNEVIFKTRTLNVSEREQLANSLTDAFGIKEESITAETISSTISSEMKRDALVAVVLALILMLVYIWFRFRDMRFGASAVIALAHDVLVVLTVYALLRVSVGSTFIACMLTIVGYSINATIVIFDRIRENLRIRRKDQDLTELVNRSITDTLSRSLFTSLTTFFMVFTLYIFGVSSIKEFALPIMAGILAGTYSSICITGALWFVLRQKFKPKHDDSGLYQEQKRAKDKAERKKQYEESKKAKTVI